MKEEAQIFGKGEVRTNILLEFTAYISYHNYRNYALCNIRIHKTT
jgi:hypothetical protein